MQLRIFSLLFCASLLYSLNLKAQTNQPEVMFIITNSGDSILTSKIIENKTNEDQVSFLLNGNTKTYQANEIKSYFKKSRKHSIYIEAENQHKLARIIVRGTYKLARSYSAKGDEKFYLFDSKKWINLDPHSHKLKEYLPKVLPDFNQGVDFAKIFYDSPSLGRAISLYNQFKDDDYNIMGYPGYTKKIKFGLLGAFGNSTITSENFINNFGGSASFNYGLEMKVIYNRVFSLKLQAIYAKDTWSGTEASIELGRLNFAALGSVEFFRPSRNLGMFVAAGPNLIFDLGSEIINRTAQGSSPKGLSAINLGYDFQLGASIGNRIDVFGSFLIHPNLKTPKGGILGNEFYEFNTKTIRGGLIYYFKK